MAAARTDTDASDTVVARRRGRSRAPNFSYEGPVSVIRLELDVSDDERLRRRVERQWAAVFRLRRALQRDAAARCRAYWAAHHERGADPKAVRERLGLSRKGLEAAAKAHIEASRVDARPSDQGRRVCMSPMRCGRPSIGTCSPTLRGAGMGRRRSGRGPTSPASPAGPVHTPRPRRCGKPTGWSAPWTGIWALTGTRGYPWR